MKLAKKDYLANNRSVPTVVFDDPTSSKLTSFGGVIVFDNLFRSLDLKNRLKICFGSEKVEPLIGFHRLTLWLILHFLIGYRQIKDVKFYKHEQR